MAIGPQITALAILIFFSAFFSGVETALMSVSMIKVKALIKQKRKGAQALHRLKQKPHQLIITILIGNNIVNIGAASLATVLFTNLFGSSGVGIATGVMTFVVLVFGEITPKTFAVQNAERVSLIVSKPIEILFYILYPLVKFFELISKAMSKLLGTKKEKLVSEEELKTVFTIGKREGILSDEAAEMMQNVLDFQKIKVTDVMTPKANMAMLDGKKQLNAVLDFIVRQPYTKFPVFIEHDDNIIGVIDQSDVLIHVRKNKLKTKIKNLAKPAYFVPESKAIANLLTDFEGKKLEISIVVDEYGDVVGLVTLDDVLEEIVGDIFDKSHREHVYIKKVSDNLIRVDAKATIEEINKVLHLGLKEEHFDTIAGFIEHKLERLPRKGEKIKLKKVTIEIDEVTKQRIKSVKILKS